MNFFLSKFLLFTLFTILILLAISIYNRFYTYNDGYFKVDSGTEYIFIGDSHVECAVNPSMDSSINVAQAAEIYLHSYYKTKMILKENSNIKAIFLDFCNFQITSKQDSILFDNAYLTKRYKAYMPFYSIQELWMLFKYNQKGLLNAHFKSLIPCLYHSICYSNFSQDNFVGGYQLLSNVLLDNTKSTNIDIKDDTSSNNNISVINLYYLDQIIELCNQNNIPLYFIRTPINDKWEYLKLERQYQNVLKTKYSDQVLLDFKDFPINNNEFADKEHLNQKGAVKFTNFLNSMMQKGLLLNSDKQQFINAQIQQLNK